MSVSPEIISQTIRYLEQQKAAGVRYLHLDSTLLQGGAPPTRAATPTRELKSAAAISGPIRIAPKPATSPEKLARFEALKSRVLQCVKCPHLVSSRTQVVFGVGSPDAELMFVGEAPGADEDLQGEPFVGKAGQLLTKMIQAMGLQRSDIFIANVLKCRPDVDTPSGNRKPTTEEMATCIPFLKEQISLIGPKVLVALGDTAVKGLQPSLKEGITRLRGQWLEFEGIPLMPTFHPAYLLRNQSMALKRQCWEDLLAAMEKLGMSISSKQRNFFLSAMGGM